MAAKPDVADFLYEIRIPVSLAVAWAALGGAIGYFIGENGSADMSSLLIDMLWHFVRGAFVATAGYLVTRSSQFGLLAAAVAGAVVMFADHVIVKGVVFLVQGELTGALGVVISYVMFFWIAATVGLLGGLLGKSQASRTKADAAI